MKVRKTSSKKRSTYVYEFTDGKKYEVKPGENGVTEAHIKLVHRMDDRDVENNLDNLHPKKTKEEKAKIKAFKLKVIADYKKEHGYEPNREYVEDAVEKKFPSNWNLSLDWEMETASGSDKSHVSKMASVDNEPSNPQVDRLYEVIGKMTERQRQVICLVEFEGYTQTEVAGILGTSIPNVKKHLDKAKEYIKNNYFEKN